MLLFGRREREQKEALEAFFRNSSTPPNDLLLSLPLWYDMVLDLITHFGNVEATPYTDVSPEFVSWLTFVMIDVWMEEDPSFLRAFTGYIFLVESTENLGFERNIESNILNLSQKDDLLLHVLQRLESVGDTNWRYTSILQPEDCELPEVEAEALDLNMNCESKGQQIWDLLGTGEPYEGNILELLYALTVFAMSSGLLTRNFRLNDRKVDSLYFLFGRGASLSNIQTSLLTLSNHPDWLSNVKSICVGDTVRSTQEVVYRNIDFTPTQASGVLMSSVYHDFFDRFCENAPRDGQLLSDFKHILISSADILNLSSDERAIISNGSVRSICKWMRKKQAERARNCGGNVDPLSQESIENIPLLFLWTHRMPNGGSECFDLVYLEQHLRSSSKNPILPTDIFSETEIANVRERYRFVYNLLKTVTDRI